VENNASINQAVLSLLPQLGAEDTAAIVAHLPRLKARLAHLTAAMPGMQHSIAIKTNPQISLLRTLVGWGYGLEAASIEEVRRAKTAGCSVDQIVFDSPVKTRLEIAEVAYERGMLVNVNTLDELERFPADATAFWAYESIHKYMRARRICLTSAKTKVNSEYPYRTSQNSFGRP